MSFTITEDQKGNRCLEFQIAENHTHKVPLPKEFWNDQNSEKFNDFVERNHQRALDHYNNWVAHGMKKYKKKEKKQQFAQQPVLREKKEKKDLSDWSDQDFYDYNWKKHAIICKERNVVLNKEGKWAVQPSGCLLLFDKKRNEWYLPMEQRYEVQESIIKKKQKEMMKQQVNLSTAIHERKEMYNATRGILHPSWKTQQGKDVAWFWDRYLRFQNINDTKAFPIQPYNVEQLDFKPSSVLPDQFVIKKCFTNDYDVVYSNNYSVEPFLSATAHLRPSEVSPESWRIYCFFCLQVYLASQFKNYGQTTFAVVNQALMKYLMWFNPLRDDENMNIYAWAPYLFQTSQGDYKYIWEVPDTEASLMEPVMFHDIMDLVDKKGEKFKRVKSKIVRWDPFSNLSWCQEITARIQYAVVLDFGMALCAHPYLKLIAQGWQRLPVQAIQHIIVQDYLPLYQVQGQDVVYVFASDEEVPIYNRNLQRCYTKEDIQTARCKKEEAGVYTPSLHVWDAGPLVPVLFALAA